MKIFAQLVWKEWHELRWKLAFGAVLSWGLAIIGFHTRVVPDETVFVVALIVAAGLLPVFAAMDVIALERAENTFQTLMSLPIGRGFIWRWKLLVHMLVFLIPVVGVMEIALLLTAGRELTWSNIQTFSGVAAGSSVMIYLWTLCLSVDQPTEARVGLVGAGVYVLWILLPVVAGIAGWQSEELNLPGSPWGGWFRLLTSPDSLGSIVVWQLAIAFALISWGHWRLAQLGKGGRA